MTPDDSKTLLVSVVVPVFNVESTLLECVASITAQTYHDIEIILVDDGSTDSSPLLCDQLANTDARIRVIHQKNQGLSGARNAGIAASQGAYLSFVDSDDCLAPAAIEIMLATMCEENADAVVGGIVNIDQHGNRSDSILHQKALYDEIAYWERALSISSGPQSMLFIISCGKLFRRQIFAEEAFDDGKLHEDEFIIHRLIARCGRIAFVHDGLYLYRHNPASITHNKSIRSYLDTAEALCLRSAYFKSKGWMRLALWSLSGASWTLVEASTADPSARQDERHAHLLQRCRKLAGELKRYSLSPREEAVLFLSLRAPHLLAHIRRTTRDHSERNR